MVKFLHIRFQFCWNGSLLGDKPKSAMIFEDICFLFSYWYEIIRVKVFVSFDAVLFEIVLCTVMDAKYWYWFSDVIWYISSSLSE